MPKISIIIPVYNSQKYLNECVDSILNQTFRDFECILIDDGSTDNSGSICDEYAKKDTRVKVIHKENGGQAAARNLGIQKAEADWVSFVDSDDCINPYTLQYLYDAAIKNNSNMAICGYKEDNDAGADFYEKPPLYINSFRVDEQKIIEYYKSKEKKNYWIICANIIKKDIVLNCPFPEGMVYEDNAVACQWLYKAQRVSEIAAPLYFYRINLEGTTKSGFSEKRFDYLKALQIQLDFYKSIGYYEIWELISYKYFGTAVWFYKTAKEKFSDTGIDKRIKKDVLKFISQNRAQLLYKDTDDEALTLLSPARMKIKRIRRGVRRRLKRRRGNA